MRRSRSGPAASSANCGFGFRTRDEMQLPSLVELRLQRHDGAVELYRSTTRKIAKEGSVAEPASRWR